MILAISALGKGFPKVGESLLIIMIRNWN